MFGNTMDLNRTLEREKKGSGISVLELGNYAEPRPPAAGDRFQLLSGSSIAAIVQPLLATWDAFGNRTENDFYWA